MMREWEIYNFLYIQYSKINVSHHRTNSNNLNPQGFKNYKTGQTIMGSWSMLCRRLCPRREPLIVCYLCLSPVKVRRVFVFLLHLFVSFFVCWLHWFVCLLFVCFVCFVFFGFALIVNLWLSAISVCPQSRYGIVCLFLFCFCLYVYVCVCVCVWHCMCMCIETWF